MQAAVLVLLPHTSKHAAENYSLVSKERPSECDKTEEMLQVTKLSVSENLNQVNRSPSMRWYINLLFWFRTDGHTRHTSVRVDSVETPPVMLRLTEV